MKKYNVRVQVNFEGIIEANSEQEAEQLAWTSWGPTYDDPNTYDCIESINVEELTHCDDCDNCMEEPYNECECRRRRRRMMMRLYLIRLISRIIMKLATLQGWIIRRDKK